MEGPIFLTLDHVLRLHDRQIERFGGAEGIHDLELLESAVAQPQQSFGGHFVHSDLAEMTAAYLFHIAKNHGFRDGNKRTAAALVFLELNGLDTDAINESEMEALTCAVAEGKADKQTAAEFFRGNIVERSE